MKNKFSIIALLGLIALTSCGGSSSDSVGSTNTSTQISTTATSTSTSTGTSVNTGVIEGNYQYFIQSDSTANRSFMRTPYIANVPSASSSYYANAQGKEGAALKTALKTLMNSKIKSIDKAASRFKTVEKDPYNSNNVWCIYVRDSYDADNIGSSGAYVWNREHTYPDSKLDMPAEEDLHILFADDNKTNSVRGNNRYGLVAHNNNTIVRDSVNRITANWSSGSYFEPCDAAKGEVARATLYAYTLYDEPIADNFTNLALCLEWHNKFPPTSWEMLRNNRVEQVQGNRNPFIDHPEYADLLF